MASDRCEYAYDFFFSLDWLLLCFLLCFSSLAPGLENQETQLMAILPKIGCNFYYKKSDNCC